MRKYKRRKGKNTKGNERKSVKEERGMEKVRETEGEIVREGKKG